MQDRDTSYFTLLKKEIAARLQQSVPGISPSIEHWKGQDIVHFQEDLAKKVNGRISEKWFYTHIKLSSDKLPRIDILNLLSKYVDCADWADFKLKNKDNITTEVNEKTSQRTYTKWIVLAGAGILFLFLLYKAIGPKTYHFCFIDADKKTPINDQPIQVVLLNDGESPVHVPCTNGCVDIRTSNDRIKFIVKAPYYKIDTITRVLNSYQGNESIHLQTNDYALMIHYFSKAKKADWDKRRRQLDNMFTENAQIYQVYESENVGMELYNKREFINKLTMPLQSLKDIEIVETIYTGSRISMLKFRQTQN
jgi:hypothetical protein